jgi:glycosyltransferase involved in cell wall biosynthesis
MSHQNCARAQGQDHGGREKGPDEKAQPPWGSRLHVLQVITKGDIGGAQTHVRILCDTLKERVHFSAAIGGEEKTPPLARALESLDIEVHRIATLGNSYAPGKLLQASIALFQIVRTLQPDILHAHSAAAGVCARIVGLLTGTPVVYTVHGFAFKPAAPLPTRVITWLCECVLAPFTSHMVCVSRYELELARTLPMRRVRQSVIPNALEDSHLRASPANAPVQIVMVARMAPPKRIDLLLHSLALLRDQLQFEVPATLLGDGPMLETSRALAEQLRLKAVVFAGDVEDVALHLSKHTIFVLLSDHEGLPISVIEAMRAGLAIVASDLPGMRELLPEVGAGILVKNDAQHITTALQTLLDDPELRARMGRNARARYEQHYWPSQMDSAMYKIYEYLVS